MQGKHGSWAGGWRTGISFNHLVALLALALASFSSWAESEPQAYRFGVFPHMPPSRLLEVFSPVAEDLAKRLGHPVQVSSAPTYERFMEELKNEQFDIAFVQPFDYVWAHDDHGYLPLARRGQPLSAIIIVAKDSPLRRVEELRGKVVANPAAVSAVAKITSVMLDQAGLDPHGDVQRSFGKSHFSCMQAVLIGRADACGTARRALAHFQEKEMEERFRIIGESDPFPHALFTVHSRIPQHEREALRQAILSWPEREEGRRLLEQGNLLPFVAAADSEYDKIRRFNGGPLGP